MKPLMRSEEEPYKSIAFAAETLIDQVVQALMTEL
jgi:hypothetical protein